MHAHLEHPNIRKRGILAPAVKWINARFVLVVLKIPNMNTDKTGCQKANFLCAQKCAQQKLCWPETGTKSQIFTVNGRSHVDLDLAHGVGAQPMTPTRNPELNTCR